MPELMLQITLVSQATFGRGDGVAGLVDIEVLHDEMGLPFLHGRSLKGLLMATCAEILGAPAMSDSSRKRFLQAAQALFGAPGSNIDRQGLLHFGPALLPQALRDALQSDARSGQRKFSREDVLAAFTTVRRQTMVDAETGAAADNTLRSMRVLDRDLVFAAALTSEDVLVAPAQALLAACVRATRHLGTRRARGLGRCRMGLFDSAGTPLTDAWMKTFEREVSQ